MVPRNEGRFELTEGNRQLRTSCRPKGEKPDQVQAGVQPGMERKGNSQPSIGKAAEKEIFEYRGYRLFGKLFSHG